MNKRLITIQIEIEEPHKPVSQSSFFVIDYFVGEIQRLLALAQEKPKLWDAARIIVGKDEPKE